MKRRIPQFFDLNFPLLQAGMTLGWLMICFMWTGCQNVSFQSSSKNRPYDRESIGLNPEVTLHRSQLPDGGVRVDMYVVVERSNLLYSRAHAEAPFVANLQVWLDGTAWEILDTAWTDSPRLWRSKWTLERDILSKHAVIEIHDLQRQSIWSKSIPWTALPEWNRHDFLVWSEQGDWPSNGSNVQVGDTLLLLFPKGAQSKLWDINLVLPPQTLPPPPYSTSRWAFDTLSPFPIASVSPDEMVEWIVPWGTTTWRQGDAPATLLLHGRRLHFPELVDPINLIEPLRYIASRSEYKELTNSDHPKLAMDQFWLKCGSNADKARMLLQTYYERVEEANHSFSGVLEGWRTDRGMVHIVFGVPDRVRQDRWNEYWIYGEEGTANALTFHFRRRSLNFDDNFYELQRSFQFRSPWDRAISNWRNGRIRGD